MEKSRRNENKKRETSREEVETTRGMEKKKEGE